MLSHFHPDSLQKVLAPYREVISQFNNPHNAFERIISTISIAPTLKSDVYIGHTKSIELASLLGVQVDNRSPEKGFTWNGKAIAGRAETSVIFHEIAHWQLASPFRRELPDFGLGPGPETGLKMLAQKFICVSEKQKEEEEDLASLLGILWEQALGGPAIVAFCEQNWLELSERASTPMHFVKAFERLVEYDLIDEAGQPVLPTAD